MTVASRSTQSNSEATFVVVANRLPVDRVENPDGSSDWRPSPGGLVTAFEPVMRSHEGAWVGWHGASARAAGALRARRPAAHPGRAVVAGGRGLLRRVLQRHPRPLYDDAITPPPFVGRGGRPGVRAQTVSALPTEPRVVAQSSSAVWAQDYQLQLVPGCSSASARPSSIGSLHIPYSARPGSHRSFGETRSFEGRGRTCRVQPFLAVRRTSCACRRPVGCSRAPAGSHHARQPPRGGRPGVPYRDRREGPQQAGRYARGGRAGGRDPPRPRHAQDHLPRRGPARLHQGPTGANPGVR